MAFVTLEDSFGEIELVLFPSTWAKTSHMVEVGSLLVVEGKMQHQERGGDSVIANSVSRIQVDDAISEAFAAEQGTDFEKKSWKVTCPICAPWHATNTRPMAVKLINPTNKSHGTAKTMSVMTRSTMR